MLQYSCKLTIVLITALLFSLSVSSIRWSFLKISYCSTESKSLAVGTKFKPLCRGNTSDSESSTVSDKLVMCVCT